MNIPPDTNLQLRRICSALSCLIWDFKDIEEFGDFENHPLFAKSLRLEQNEIELPLLLQLKDPDFVYPNKSFGQSHTHFFDRLLSFGGKGIIRDSIGEFDFAWIPYRISSLVAPDLFDGEFAVLLAINLRISGREKSLELDKEISEILVDIIRKCRARRVQYGSDFGLYLSDARKEREKLYPADKEPEKLAPFKDYLFPISVYPKEDFPPGSLEELKKLNLHRIEELENGSILIQITSIPYNINEGLMDQAAAILGKRVIKPPVDEV